MILFINPLLSDISIIVTDGTSIIEKKSIKKNKDSAFVFPREVIEIMDRHTIDEIWCITGPGPFTLMRVITLTCNAIKLSRQIKLKGCHFFDILDTAYIPIIQINPHECIIRENNHERIVSITDLPNETYIGIIDINNFTEKKKIIQYSEDIEKIQKKFGIQEYSENLSPIYFKAPHITGSSKKISPFCETTNAL